MKARVPRSETLNWAPPSELIATPWTRGAGEPVTRQPERDRTVRRTPVRPREDDVRWSSETASWVPSGVTDWLAAAQRGYTTEIVPRLSGRVPAVIVARKPDEDANRETETGVTPPSVHAAAVRSSIAVRRSSQLASTPGGGR